MANSNLPRYYPPGLPRSNDLVRAYDLIYGIQAQLQTLAANNNASPPASSASNAAVTPLIGYGPFEQRYGNLSQAQAGAFWIETSRNNVTATPPLLIYRWSGNSWLYIEGQIVRPQNGLSTLFGTLSPLDNGLLIHVSDYRHQLQWGNNNTTWGPNDDGRAGEIAFFEVDPSPATGWQLYAGNNNVNYLQANGTLGTVNLPNLTGNGDSAYLKAGSPNSGPSNNSANGNATPTIVRRPWFRQ